MSNSYFQFKQFLIRQDQCAMKVCTDACILGAWFSEKIPDYSYILDIGCGSGLLTLMLAQKTKGEIHGIELDLGSYKQSKVNIQESPWNERIRVFPGDARTFAYPNKYDFIIANPPFFEGDLQTSSHAKNLAMHSSELNLTGLLSVIDTNLDMGGSFGLLLPYQRSSYFEMLATEHKFHLREKLQIKQSPSHGFFRTILFFSRKPEHFVPVMELCIKDETGVYTEDFRELLADYYLHL